MLYEVITGFICDCHRKTLSEIGLVSYVLENCFFLEDVGLHGAAHGGERPCLDLLVLVVRGLAAVVRLA